MSPKVFLELHRLNAKFCNLLEQLVFVTEEAQNSILLDIGYLLSLNFTFPLVYVYITIVFTLKLKLNYIMGKKREKKNVQLYK